jgi:hypothetical protein
MRARSSAQEAVTFSSKHPTKLVSRPGDKFYWH